MKSKILLITGAALSGLFIFTSSLFAQGTAFTYQGRLTDGTNLANGDYDFRFRLASDPQGNNLVGSAVVITNMPVNNGLFTAVMDFNAGIFGGSDYWLQVEVRSNGVSGYTTLVPLQALTPTPYAIFATTAANLAGTLPAGQLSGSIPSTNIAGIYSNAVIFNNAANSFSGDGTGLTALNASNLGSGTVPDTRLSANIPQLNANQTFTGGNTFNDSGNSFTGNGAGLTALNASSLATGTMPDLRLSSNVAQLGANQTFTGANNFNNAGNIFTGNGLGLTALNASSLGSGTVPDARLSTNVPQLKSQTNVFNGAVVASDVKLANGAQSAVSALDSIRIVQGIIASNGTNVNGTGFSAIRTGIGTYQVVFNPGFNTGLPASFSGIPAVVVSSIPLSGSPVTATATINYSGSSFTTTVETWNVNGVHVDNAFHIIAVGGR